MRGSRADRVKIREAIVEEAGKVLLAHGPDKATIAQIMGSVGKTHGAFYAHFDSKDDLFAAAVDLVIRDIVDWCDVQTADGSISLVEFVDAFLGSGCAEHQVRARTLVVLAASADRLSTEARDRLRLMLADLVEAVSRSLNPHHGAAQRARVDAEMLISELVGARLLAQASGDPAAGAALLSRVRLAMHRRLCL